MNADRHKLVGEAIAAGDVRRLMEFAEGFPCACLGPRDGEPKCPCKMMSDAARSRVSYAALKRGKIIVLAPKHPSPSA